MATITCDICGQSHGKPLLNCITCARSSLYIHRIDLGRSLVEKEAVSLQVDAVISGDTTRVASTTTLDGAIVDLRDCARSNRANNVAADLVLVNERIHQISNKAVELKRAMEEMSRTISQKRGVIASRKSDADSAWYDIDNRSAREISQIDKKTRATRSHWDSKHAFIMQGRLSLCRKSALLLGLKRSLKYEERTMRELYEISRLPIFDLRNLNKAAPEVLTASLTQVARLVVQISTYIAIRLPAEIILPNAEIPQSAAILPPSASYMNRDRPTSPSSRGSTSPSVSRVLQPGGRTARMRLLFTSRALPKLHKEDPAAHLLFIEGVTLLAWNVAWLCKTQGMSGMNSWTDICAVGRNLWQLLMSDNRGLSKENSDSGKQAPAANNNNDDDDEIRPRSNNPPAHFGRFSHGSARHFFTSPEGAELMRGWKLATPTKAIDKVKAHLVAEMQGAEWEVLNEEEWNDHDELLGSQEQPVVVHGRKFSSTAAAAASDAGKSARPGTTGWTRLRQRTESSNTVKKPSSNVNPQR